VDELANHVGSRGPTTVLVTEGARGATLLHGGEIYRGSSSGEPFDTLGAGDSFIGTVLAGLLTGKSPEEALAMASAAAAATCQHHGGFGHGRELAG
jgi:fructoselysine 6-kinase